MADVFISYSRKDKEFAHRLQETLVEHEREPWLDTQDIPPTAEWLQEIYGAIEKADSFVFVISPDVLGSQVCQLELAPRGEAPQTPHPGGAAGCGPQRRP